jgi:DNA polymerase-3 subunit gamma/tau
MLDAQAARMAAAQEPPPPPASSPRLVQRDGGRQHQEGGQTSGALALAEAPRREPVVVAPVEDERTLTWRTILERVRAVKPGTASTLELAAPVTVTREKLVLAFERDSFEDARAEETDARLLVEEHARAHFRAQTEVTFEVAARGSKVASIAFIDAAKRRAQIAEARAAVERHTLVRKVMTLLDAELREIRLPEQD